MFEIYERLVHKGTNASYWLESHEWVPTTPARKIGKWIVGQVPFSIHEVQKKRLFHTDNLIAVNSESVVVDKGDGFVDKVMLRKPAAVTTDSFAEAVAKEVTAVTACLEGIALPTIVAIKKSKVLRFVGDSTAVTQSQEKLNLEHYQKFDIDSLSTLGSQPYDERTYEDLARVVEGSHELMTSFGYLPDVIAYGGNFLRDKRDGSLTLLDVMPFYADGSRLINDRPSDFIANQITETLLAFELALAVRDAA